MDDIIQQVNDIIDELDAELPAPIDPEVDHESLSESKLELAKDHLVAAMGLAAGVQLHLDKFRALFEDEDDLVDLIDDEDDDEYDDD